MGSPPPVSFAALLRSYRQAAGMTQEELAERARLSVQAIGALERGDRRAPRKETVNLLAEALALTGPTRDAFAAAARQREERDTPASPLFTATSPPAPARPDAATPTDTSQASAAVTAFLAARNGLMSRARGASSRKIVSVVMVALLGGSALLIRGEAGALAGRPPLLCGGQIAIATEAPTSGIPRGAGGKAEEDAADLAVLQNPRLGGGYTLHISNYDDAIAETAPDRNVSAANVKRMVNDPCIVGIVGPYNSNVAEVELPIAARAGVVMVSPAATNPALTLRPYAQAQDLDFDALHPPGKPLNFFRVVPNDASQGVADADVMFSLGKNSVYLVSNNGAYGETLVANFAPAFEAKGGRIAGLDRIDFDTSVIPDIAARIVAAHPDAVFYGGVTSSGAGLLKASLTSLSYRGLFLGGDGITDADFVKQAGPNAAEGVYATVGGRDPSTFTSGAAARFRADYAAAFPGLEATFYGAETYDAAMVLISAIRQVVASGQPLSRATVTAQVQRTQYNGITGPISFDPNGDIAHGVFGIYVVRQGAWTYASQMSL